MLQSKVLALAGVMLLVAGASGYAQQAGQQQMRSLDTAQRIERLADQQDISLDKLIQTAEREGDGKVVAAALVMHGQSGGMGGQQQRQQQQQQQRQQQNLVAHVVLVGDNQLKLALVDAQNNRLLNVENRQTITNLWQPTSGMGGSTGGGGASGSISGSGASGSMNGASGSVSGGGSGDTSQQGIERTGSGGQGLERRAGGGSAGQGMQQQQQGMGGQAGQGLTFNTAQQIVRLADQNNADLRKAVQLAERQSDSKAVAAFLALPGQTPGTAGMADPGQQPDVIAHVYTVENNQLRLYVIDAQNNRVLTTENRQMLSAPWERQTGAGMGGTIRQGQQGQNQQGTGAGNWPTGSSQGTGQGTLGGPDDGQIEIEVDEDDVQIED